MDFDQFLAELNQFFGVEGEGYYTLDELRQLLGDCGFRILEYRYSPGLVSSLIWEIGIVFSYRFSGSGIPLALLFLLYPLVLLDRLPIFRNAPGCELVVKCVRGNK